MDQIVVSPAPSPVAGLVMLVCPVPEAPRGTTKRIGEKAISWQTPEKLYGSLKSAEANYLEPQKLTR